MEYAAPTAKCSGVGCSAEAATLRCPTCLNEGHTAASFFCSQDCFRNSWSEHKNVHKKKLFNPFPDYPFTGPLRPVYPLSDHRAVPDTIKSPPWSEDGNPRYPGLSTSRSRPQSLDASAQALMREVCQLAREVLDIAAAAAVPGVTTDDIDKVVHEACIKRNAYPSPLRYNSFPKSVCTSVNEVICHGIPDQRVLEDGDILNIDVSLFHKGYHGDLNETYYIGDKARADQDSVRVVEAARECLDQAIAACRPGTPIRTFGDIIERHAKSQKCSVIRTYCGHGIHKWFHCAPNVPHYGNNKAVGVCMPGMTFTIEPMIALGTFKDVTWPDSWTSTTKDGMRTAQFEHTLLVTEDGVEVLTARKENSPGGPVPMPSIVLD